MGSGDYKRRLQAGIFGETKIFGDKTDCAKFRTFATFKFRNKRIINKKGNRTRFGSPSSSRVLQQSISSSQEKRKNENGHKSKTTQQISPETTFQNGHHDKSIEPSQRRRLGDYDRSCRRLFSYSDIPKTQTIFTLFNSRPKLSIPLSVFRSNISTESLYKDSVRGSRTSTVAQCTASNIPGRLVSSQPFETQISPRSCSNSGSPSSPGFHCKQSKINACSIADNHLYRGPIQIRSGESLPNSRQIDKTKSSHSMPVARQRPSSGLPNSSRHDGFMHRVNPVCPSVHASNPMASTSVLESIKNGLRASSPSVSFAKMPSLMVASDSEHTKGTLFSTNTDSGSSNHRCCERRLGRPLEKPNSTGILVKHNEATPYQLLGVRGGCIDNQTFSTTTARQEHSDSLGQHYSGPIHKSARGHSLPSASHSDMELMDASSSEQYGFESCPHSGSEKCSSRLSEPIPDTRNRMVSEHTDCESDIPSLGSSDHRFVRVNQQSQNSSVLFMDSASSGSGNRCFVHKLGKHVCVCVPPSMPCTQSTSTHATVSVRNNTDSSMLAKATMVPSVTSAVDSMPNKTTTRSQSIESNGGKNCTSTSRNTQPDCMDVIDKHLQAEGFSQNARNLLSASWRDGTKKDYRSKFRRFSCWCLQHKIDPYSASLKHCANFLTCMFEKGLKYSTIAGYRSMLSTVLAPIDKVPVGQHPYIIRLLKGVFNKRPPVRKLLPEWDLLLVLGELKKAPFEPMKDARLKFITWKTAFLIAITTFRRCSDLQSLKLGEGSVNVQSKGVTFVRQGFSKQDRPNHKKSTIFVPSLPNNKLLDPKRSLSFYLRQTEPFRRSGDKDETKLFLSYVKPHKPVSAQTISKWIVNTIKFAYKRHNKTVSNVKGHSTRAVGPSWAIYRGAPVNSVLESADWAKESTFTRHYLKTVNVDFLQC